jgi:DNA-binding NarL/FixJ family response regulator
VPAVRQNCVPSRPNSAVDTRSGWQGARECGYCPARRPTTGPPEHTPSSRGVDRGSLVVLGPRSAGSRAVSGWKHKELIAVVVDGAYPGRTRPQSRCVDVTVGKMDTPGRPRRRFAPAPKGAEKPLAHLRAALVEHGRVPERPLTVISDGEVANARLSKRRKMRWSPRGAHCVALHRAVHLGGRLVAAIQGDTWQPISPVSFHFQPEPAMSQYNTFILASNQLLRDALKLRLKRSSLVVTGEGKDLDEARQQSAHAPNIIVVIGTNSGSIDAALEDIGKAATTYPGVKCAMIADRFSAAETLRALQAGADAVVSMDASFNTILSSLTLVLDGLKVFPTLPAHLLIPRSGPSDDPTRPIPLRISVSQSGAAVQGMPNSTPSRQWHDPLRADVIRVPPKPVAFGGNDDVVGPLVLSDRERQVLHHLVNGHPNKIIARELGIAETTVKVHVKSVIRKMGVSNRTQAAMGAVRQNLIQPGPERRSGMVNGVSNEP